MKIEIKLPDPKYCTGCVCFSISYRSKYFCKLGHKNLIGFDKKTGKILNIVRPRKCIEERGE